MTLSFLIWSMACFDRKNFAICGKTISSVRRNVIVPVRELLSEMGFECREKISQNYLELSCGGRTNRYYLFSGKDSASAASIQGMTLAGVFFDEVALQNRDFVEQAVARCSIEGSKFWFNCNPEHPGHWFYTDWICRRKEKICIIFIFGWRIILLFPLGCADDTKIFTAETFMSASCWGNGYSLRGLFIRCFPKRGTCWTVVRSADDFWFPATMERLIHVRWGCGARLMECGIAWMNTIMIPEKKESVEPMRSIMLSWNVCVQGNRWRQLL